MQSESWVHGAPEHQVHRLLGSFGDMPLNDIKWDGSTLLGLTVVGEPLFDDAFWVAKVVHPVASY